MHRQICKVAVLLVCVVCVGCSSAERTPAPAQQESGDGSARSANTESLTSVDSEPRATADALGGMGSMNPAEATSRLSETESLSDSASPTADELEAPSFLDAPSTSTGEDRTPAETPIARDRQPRDARQGQVEPGTLTAGSFDDHERFDDYQRFLSEAMQQDVHEVLPRIEQGRRVEILVTDSQGKALADAQITVCHARSQSTLLDTSTAADGRAFFMTSPDDRGEYEVSVTPPDGSVPVTQTIVSDQSPCRIMLPDAVATLPRQLDLALVVDTTGSMGDELEYLKAEIDDIAQSIHRMYPNVDQRYALIVYRDRGDSYVTQCYDFTSSLSEFRSTLARQSAQGGGDYPEAVHIALEQAGELNWRDRNTARVLFLVGDAPPHDEFVGRTIEAVEDLQKRCVRVFPTAASGVALKAEFIMRAAAFLTQGKYLFLTDHSGVGNPHAEPHVPDYQVEHLNRLMIRMIASELAGRNLAPREVVAIEQGALSVSRSSPGEPWTPQQQQSNTVPVPPQDSAAVLPGNGKMLPWAHVSKWILVAVLGVSLFAIDVVSRRNRS